MSKLSQLNQQITRQNSQSMIYSKSDAGFLDDGWDAWFMMS
jgi:hypothetical protein